MTRETPKTVLVLERSSGEPLAPHEIDGSSEFLRDEDRLPEGALDHLPLVDWPVRQRPEGFGSPLRWPSRTRKAD